MTIFVFCPILSKAAAGFFEYYINTNVSNYGNYSGGSPFSGVLANNINLNSSSLFLDLSGVKTWENDSDQINSAQINYRVYADGSTPDGFSSQSLPQFGTKNDNNREWQNGTNIDLLSGLSGTGTYIVEIYFTAQGTWSGGSYEITYPAPGSSYSASFTVTTALPVNFLNFDIEKDEDMVKLSWRVESENFHSHYEIERSIDGLTWKKIGTSSGNESRSRLKNYQFADQSPVKGRNYYRIKQVDLDGTFMFSEIRSVHLNMSSGELNVFPNPSVDKNIKVEFYQKGVIVQKISISNIEGKRIFEKEVANEMVNEHINLPASAKGFYFINLIDNTGNSLSNKKIVVY